VDGRALAGAFWAECVAPALVELGCPPVGAALLGYGSEVLGFDDDRSTDHNFGPRLQVFVGERSTKAERGDLTAALDRALPTEFGGRPVRFALTTDPLVRHRVQVTTVGRLFRAVSGLDPTAGSIPATAWLRTSTQSLAELTGGAVFADPDGQLAAARDVLRWYPPDVWRYVLACQWKRLSQHEAFVGRAGEVGDDTGSRVISARLARDLMRLGFLLERTWAPYDKWLGSAFGRLALAPAVEPHLARLMSTATWTDRQDAYAEAASALSTRFNELDLIAAIDPTPRPYHGRPFHVLHAERFAEACLAATPLRTRGWRGAVDQWIDNVDVLGDRAWLAAGDDRDADLGLDERLLQPVVVREPLDRWPADFGRLATLIGDALGALALDIEHIGSTSVPGLPAKDVIDVQVLVAQLEPAEPLVDAFASIGMVQSTEPWNRREAVPEGWTGPPEAWDQLVFRSLDADPPANVHVRVDGSAGARRSRLFRDYLRANPAARDSWGRFKVQLAGRVRHLAAYGQVKAPATELVLADAERWAAASGW
jgi:GrpB-like predicted nucleotidyltransferase (UPF0157 family)